MKALLIAPNRERQQVLADALRHQGFELTTTAEPETACQLQQAEGYPLVVLAAEPLEEGVEICRQLRGVPCWQPFWVLASANGSPAGRVEDFLAAGADDVLLFPLDARHLKARLAMAKRRAEAMCAVARRDGTETAAEGRLDGSSCQPELLFRSLIEHMSDLVFVLDADGRIHFSNQTARRAAEEETLAAHCSHYFAPAHVQSLLQTTKRALDTNSIQFLPAANLEGRWWEARVVPLAQAEPADKVLLICTDMSDRQRAVELLRESEQRYRLIAENVTDVIWIAEFDEPVLLPESLDPDASMQLALQLLERWRFTYVSPSVQRAQGYSVLEFLAMRLGRLLTSDTCDSIRRILAEEMHRETEPNCDPHRSRVIEIQQFTKDGHICHSEARATFLRNAEGRITGMLGVTRDITERRQAEEALRESEATLRGLVQNMPDTVLVVDREGVVLYVNRGAHSSQADDLIGKVVLDYVSPEYRASCWLAVQNAFDSQKVQSCEGCDVFHRYWACRAVPIREGDDVRSVMVICTDITEKKLAEAEVQKEQDLLRHLLELFERDRELAAFEIHDGVAQQLTGALLNFEASERIAATSPAEAKRTYREGLRLLRQSIEEARRLISGLRPPALDAFGIISAIEQLVQENLALGSAQIELITAGQFDRLARPLENAVFRIVQESLSNARRHSQTKKIRVELGRADDRIRLTVRDWGVGFDPEQVSADRFGLKGIRERARLLGGTAKFDTGPGKGTSVVVDLPLILRTVETPQEEDTEETPSNGCQTAEMT